jgi:hypothetical protein
MSAPRGRAGLNVDRLDSVVRDAEAAARPAANKETNSENSQYYAPPGGSVDAIGMTRLKRFIRPGFAISAIGHIGALILALLFFYAGADSSRPRPPPPPAISVDLIPPDAMVADIVPPKETPRLEGTPSDSAVSGSYVLFKSKSANTAAQAPPPKPIAQSPPEHSDPTHNADPKTSPPLTAQAEMVQAQMALPLAAQADTAHPQTPVPETAHRETAQTQTSEPQPSPPQPDPRDTPPDQSGAEQTLAQLALLGGPLGGGFEAPAIDAPTAAHDFTLAFRERVSACSALPASIGFGDKIAVSLHVSFNPDGTLASPPKSNGTIGSQKERELLQSAVSALEKCQPYTMLPADKYKAWKTLDLIVGPMSFPGR